MEIVTVVAPGETIDGHGNPLADWTDTVRTDVAGCLWAPGTEAEDHTSGRQGVPVAGTLYMPPGAPVSADDRVEVRGAVFEVDAEPAEWRSSGGTTRGIEVKLRRFDG